MSNRFTVSLPSAECGRVCQNSTRSRACMSESVEKRCRPSHGGAYMCPYPEFSCIGEEEACVAPVLTSVTSKRLLRRLGGSHVSVGILLL